MAPPQLSAIKILPRRSKKYAVDGGAPVPEGSDHIGLSACGCPGSRRGGQKGNDLVCQVVRSRKSVENDVRLFQRQSLHGDEKVPDSLL